MMNPFRACLECLQGPSFSATESYAHLREEVHCVKLDTSFMGLYRALKFNEIYPDAFQEVKWFC